MRYLRDVRVLSTAPVVLTNLYRRPVPAGKSARSPNVLKKREICSAARCGGLRISLSNAYPLRRLHVHRLRSAPQACTRSAVLGRLPWPTRRDGSSSASARPPRCHSRSTPTCSACLRFQARERRPRHARPPTLPRAQEHPAYRPVHRDGARPVQGFLERLRSPARRQWRLALSRLALPRSNGGVRSSAAGSTCAWEAQAARGVVVATAVVSTASPSITLAWSPAARRSRRS